MKAFGVLVGNILAIVVGIVALGFVAGLVYRLIGFGMLIAGVEFK